MNKLIKTMMVLGLFGAGAVGVALTGTPLASAQATKGSEKTKPAEKPAEKSGTKPAAAKGSLVVKPGKDDRFRIFIRNEDGKTIMMSSGNGFETEKEAKEAIDEIKAILKDAKVTTEKADPKEPSKDKEKDK
jgi:uncharacterized protein YegP (UPF0339 family)